MFTRFIGLTDNITQVVPVDNKTLNTVQAALQQQDIEHSVIHHSIFISTVFVRDVKRILDINNIQ